MMNEGFLKIIWGTWAGKFFTQKEFFPIPAAEKNPFNLHTGKNDS